MLSHKLTIILIVFFLQISLFLFWKPTSVAAVCSFSSGTEPCTSSSHCSQGTITYDSTGAPLPEIECTLYTCVSGFCAAPSSSGTAPSTGTAPTAVPPGPKGAGTPCNPPQEGHLLTAIGCVPTNPSEFILAVSQLLSGAGGGIALLLMIAGAFRMITSGGNPDAVKAGSEQFTSALIGLLFIIFAVLLLKVIGVNILNLPGFGSV